MSQATHAIQDSDGGTFLTNLRACTAALASTYIGNTAPETEYRLAGMFWLDNSTNNWLWKVFDGTDWITVGTIDTTENSFTSPDSFDADSALVVGPLVLT